MEEEKILNVTQLGVVDKLQNEDVILLIRNTDNGKQCFQIKGFDFRGESAYEAAQSQGFEGTYQDWVQHIKEITEYDTKSLLSFNGIANNDANSALRSGIYPSVTKNVPMDGETFTVQTLRTTTAVYNQYVSTQIALGATGAAIGKVYIRKNTQKSGAYTFGDWIKISNYTSATKKTKPKTQYIIGKAIPIGSLNGGARLNAYAVNGFLRFKLSKVPQLGSIISHTHTGHDVDALLNNVTWHVFIDGDEWGDVKVATECNGDILRTNVKLKGFYMLDNTANNSGDLSSDMYIYLKTVIEGTLDGVKCTSETLRYYEFNRIWEPFIYPPTIDETNEFYIKHFSLDFIQLQRLLTRQRCSVFSGKSRSYFSYTNYRGRFERYPIVHYGVYRYRIVKNGKKTQWHTINIIRANNERTFFIIK